MFFAEVAHAMGSAGQQAQDGGSLMALGWFPLIFIVMYFFMIRPQKKKADEHKKMMADLKKGDGVITVGGIYGRIVEKHDDTFILDLGDAKITVGRSFIGNLQQSKSTKTDANKESKKGAISK